ncbi:hypothetical protein G5I_04713 [Acromyrmex echinatior]|uniref:Uncharacterized protein n=1 Tax=Acromyrmex echinatior TaxID=103372 RepID=F4WGD9_ACREC|nr:hypothetical protein G5I_04713 [Acromyrmex echinatior]
MPGQWDYLPPTPKPLEGVQQSRRSSPCSFHCAHVVGGGLVGAIPPSLPSSSCTLEGSKVEKILKFQKYWINLKEPVLPILDFFTTQLMLHILQRHKFHVYSKILQILSALFTPFDRNQSICCAMTIELLFRKEDIVKQPATADMRDTSSVSALSYAQRHCRGFNITEGIIDVNIGDSFEIVPTYDKQFCQIPAVSSQFRSCDCRFRDCFVLQFLDCQIDAVEYVVINPTTNILRNVKYVIRSSLLKAVKSYPWYDVGESYNVDDANITRCLRQMAIYAIASWGVMMLHKNSKRFTSLEEWDKNAPEVIECTKMNTSNESHSEE